MKRNKKRNMILSVLIALALWSFVIYTTDPVRNKIVTNIPVTVTGQEALLERGLAVVGADSVTTDISIKAQRSILGGVDADDIKISIDVSNCVMGDNYLPMDMTFSKDIKLSSDTTRQVHIKVEKIVTEARKVELVYGEGTEKASAELKRPDIVHIMGTVTEVKQVAYVAAFLTSGDIESGSENIKKHLVPVDENGERVSGITMDEDEAVVHMLNYETKEVPLKVEVTGEPAEGYGLVSVELPDTVTLRGNKKLIEKVTSVTGRTIDITGISATKKKLIAITLPKGVFLADDRNPIAVITVASKELNEEQRIEISDVSFENVGFGLTASSNDVVTVIGHGIVKSKIKVYADLKGLEEGTHKVKVKAVSSDGKNVRVEPKEIEVKLIEE